MASFLSLSPSSLSFSTHWPTICCHASQNQPRFGFSGKTWHRRFFLLPLRCSSSESPQESESEVATTTSVPSSSGDWTYRLIAGIGGVGFLETAYLTFLKLTNSEVFCPIGGGTCGDILNSDYAFAFGIPLPLIGMASYGLVAALGLQLISKNLPFGVSKSNAQLMLLASTTSMAAASAYFLYILSTKFSGSSCSYCLLSALLSFSLFFVTIKDLGWQETQKAVGLQLFIASLVIVTLNTSYSISKSVSSSPAEIELPYYATEITAPSSPFAISLAKHLHSIGAKMYGAFWCSHCLEQKEIFGREAAKLLDYVECFPEGYRTGAKMVKACTDAGLEGFPAWIINGQENLMVISGTYVQGLHTLSILLKVLSGQKELSELAQVSDFNESTLSLD